jgi:hypothetical protein
LLVFLPHGIASPKPFQPARRTGHHGHVGEVDDDQLAALRRLRAAFGFVEVLES